jgi:ATP-dependent DNA helicase RecG
MRYCLPGKKVPDLFSEMEVNSEHYQEKSEHKESSSEHYAHLLRLAESIRNKQRTLPEQVKSVIVQLCANEFLSLRTVAELLNRAPDSIRNHYIKPMLKDGLLEARYPLQHNHPKQVYKTRIENQ